MAKINGIDTTKEDVVGLRLQVGFNFVIEKVQDIGTSYD